MILHLVTDRRRLAPGRSATFALDCLCRQIALAVAAGVDVIQIREGDLEARDLLTLTIRALELAHGSATRVVVNDRLDVALAAGADGVHLPARSLPVAAVRQHVPQGFVIGRSVHGEAELDAAAGADYVVAGTVWPTPSKPSSVDTLGIEGLARLTRRSTVPVVAIGGVTVDRAADLRRAGAAGAAAIGLFLEADAARGCGAIELIATVRALRARFDTPGSGS